MKTEVLAILGSPNSPTGVLSAISKSRLNYCSKIYARGTLVLCTGGWGAHFNTAEKAHAAYAKDYLLKKGVLEDDFLDMALSSNTVDDAVKMQPILTPLQLIDLTIITSDYHLERVTLIFNEILKTYRPKFVGVPSNLDKQDYAVLIDHEQKAIQSILKNGLYY